MQFSSPAFLFFFPSSCGKQFGVPGKIEDEGGGRKGGHNGGRAYYTEGGGYFMHGFGAVMDRCGGGTRKKVHMLPEKTQKSKPANSWFVFKYLFSPKPSLSTWDFMCF